MHNIDKPWRWKVCLQNFDVTIKFVFRYIIIWWRGWFHINLEIYKMREDGSSELLWMLWYDITPIAWIKIFIFIACIVYIRRLWLYESSRERLIEFLYRNRLEIWYSRFLYLWNIIYTECIKYYKKICLYFYIEYTGYRYRFIYNIEKVDKKRRNIINFFSYLINWLLDCYFRLNNSKKVVKVRKNLTDCYFRLNNSKKVVKVRKNLTDCYFRLNNSKKVVKVRKNLTDCYFRLNNSILQIKIKFLICNINFLKLKLNFKIFILGWLIKIKQKLINYFDKFVNLLIKIKQKLIYYFDKFVNLLIKIKIKILNIESKILTIKISILSWLLRIKLIRFLLKIKFKILNWWFFKKKKIFLFFWKIKKKILKLKMKLSVRRFFKRRWIKIKRYLINYFKSKFK